MEESGREKGRERAITGTRRQYRGSTPFRPPILVVREEKKERERPKRRKEERKNKQQFKNLWSDYANCVRSRLPLSILEFSNANLRRKTLGKANGIVGKPTGKIRERSERERERERKREDQHRNQTTASRICAFHATHT